MKPEEQARQRIDLLLTQAGWLVQAYAQLNLGAGRGIAIREFPLSTGPADYLLVVDRQAVGVVEAKKVGETFTGVEAQSAKYREGRPGALPMARIPLPFAYESTGVEARFTNGLDPEPRSRPVFAFHRPVTQVEWLAQVPEGGNQLLRAHLAAGPQPARTALKAARAAGIATRTLHRAKDALGVRPERSGGYGAHGQWICYPVEAQSKQAAPAVSRALATRRG